MNMIFYSLSLCRDIFHCHKNHYLYSSKVDVFTVGHWAGATRATYPQGSNIINKLCLMTPVIPLGVTLFQMICTYVMIAHVACDLPRICRRYSFTLNLAGLWGSASTVFVKVLILLVLKFTDTENGTQLEPVPFWCVLYINERNVCCFVLLISGFIIKIQCHNM